jgi:N-acetyl-gamma-glutamyl-phosphate reductase
MTSRKVRVAIVGASGYTALEAIEWLIDHPHVEIVAATSRQANGSMLADMHPSLVRRIRLPVEDLTSKQIAERADVALTCLPHGASAHIIMELLDEGCRVIDLSAAKLAAPTSSWAIVSGVLSQRGAGRGDKRVVVLRLLAHHRGPVH